MKNDASFCDFDQTGFLANLGVLDSYKLYLPSRSVLHNLVLVLFQQNVKPAVAGFFTKIQVLDGSLTSFLGMIHMIAGWGASR